jgi:hypothetical protein
VGKNKGQGRTMKLQRKATYVRGKHLVIDKAGAPVRTLNIVQRAKLNPKPPTEEGGEWGSPDVFFKPHDDEDAASQYAVASTRLARFLGMPNLIARNAFAKVKNVLGVVSGAVPGKPLVWREKNKEVPVPAGFGQQDIRDWVRAGQRQERGGKYYETSKEIHQWVNFKDPRIQKGMSDLQLFDAITGQIDRHGGNIFVDPKTGTVSGIDDDKAFGKGRPAGERQAQPGTGDHQHYRALPALVDEDTANRILALDPTKLPDVLLSRVNDSKVLNDKEIEDALRRFQGVRQYLRQLKKDGALVGQNRYPSWNDATYQQALQDPTHSYLGDQAAELERVIQLAANDPEFEVVDMPLSQVPPPPPVAAPPPLPPQVMAPQQRPRLWQPATLPPSVPPITLPQPSTSLGPESPRTGPVSPGRAAAARLAAARLAQSPRTVPPPPPVKEVDDSGDLPEDSTSPADDQLLAEQ